MQPAAPTGEAWAVPPAHVFASRRHPGDGSAAYVYATELSGPMALAMTVLMVVSASAVLLGQDPLPDLVWAGPLAAALAITFTVYHLRSTPVEILIYADAAAVRTIWDVAMRKPAVPLRVLPPRRVQEGLNVGIGGDVLTLTEEEWPGLNVLGAELTAAADRALPDRT